MTSVLVTGASRGLGRHIAVAFAQQHCRVGINCVRRLAEAAETGELVTQAGGEPLLCRADVSRVGDVDEMFAVLRDRWETLDVLVNNAGIADDRLTMQMSEAQWQRVLDVTVRGASLCAARAAAMMPRGGHIVNIASLSGAVGRAGQANYSAAKAALIGMTKSLAAELGGANIRVNAVLPGYLPTEMGAAAPRAMAQAARDSVLGRLADPDEVARFIEHLCSTQGVSGQVFSIDSRLWG